MPIYYRRKLDLIRRLFGEQFELEFEVEDTEEEDLENGQESAQEKEDEEDKDIKKNIVNLETKMANHFSFQDVDSYDGETTSLVDR